MSRKASVKTKHPFPSIEAELSQRLAELTHTLFTTPEGFNYNELQAKKYGCYQFTLDTPSDDREAKSYWTKIRPVFEKTFGKENARQVFEDFQTLCPDGVEIFAYAEGASSYPRYEFCGDLLLRFTYVSALHVIEHQKEKTRKPEQIAEQINKCVSIKVNIEKAFDDAQSRLKELYQPIKHDRSKTILIDNHLSSEDLGEQKTPKKIDEEKHFTQLRKIIQDFDTTVITQLAHLNPKNAIPSQAELEKTRQALNKYQQMQQSDRLQTSDRSLYRDLFRMDFKADKAPQKIQLYLRHIAKTSTQRISSPLLPLKTTSTPHGNAATLPNFSKTYEGTWIKNSATHQPIVTISLESTRAGTPMDSNRMIRFPTNRILQMRQAMKAFNNFQQLLQMLRATAIQRTLLLADKKNRMSLAEKHHFSEQFADHISQKMIENSQTQQPINTYKIMKDFIKHEQKTNTTIRQYRFSLYGLSDQIVRPTIVYTHLGLTQNVKYHNLERQQWKICRLNQYLLDQRIKTQDQFPDYQPGLIYFLFPISPSSHMPAIQPQISANNKANLVQLFLLFKKAFPKKATSKITINTDQFQKTRQTLSQAALAFYRTRVWQENRDGVKGRYKAREKNFFIASDTIFNQLKKYFTAPKLRPDTPEEILLQIIFQIFVTGTWVKTYQGLLPALIHVLVNFISHTKVRLSVRALGGCRSTNDRMQLLALLLTKFTQYKQHPETFSRMLQVDKQLAPFINRSAEDFPFNLSHIQTIFSNSGMPKISDWVESDQPNGFSAWQLCSLQEEKVKDPALLSEYRSFSSLSQLAPHKRKHQSRTGLIFHQNFQFWNDHLKCHAGLKEDINQQFYQYCVYTWLSNQKKESIAQSIRSVLRLDTSTSEGKLNIARNWLFSILNYEEFLKAPPSEYGSAIDLFYLTSFLYIPKEDIVKSQHYDEMKPKEKMSHLFEWYHQAVHFDLTKHSVDNPKTIIAFCPHLLMLHFDSLAHFVESIQISTQSFQQAETKQSDALSPATLLSQLIWGTPTASPKEEVQLEDSNPRHFHKQSSPLSFPPLSPTLEL